MSRSSVRCSTYPVTRPQQVETVLRIARIALVGDRHPDVAAHNAIPLALELAGRAAGVTAEWEWVHTTTIPDGPAGRLAGFDAIWCVPASPYANTTGALATIRFAREHGRPFLGTCGGFQHALLEYAVNVWGIENAAHAELTPGASNPVIAPLSCSLVDVTDDLRLVNGSRLAQIYGVPAATEGYHCSYGLNPQYAERLETGPLRVGARDAAGEVRAVELDGHRFFMATLFQPERSALANHAHPLLAALVTAASRGRRGD